ncbi:MAG TPA: GNAT family N-acetyltransferase, partial [Geodermatophilus sp.]|nr:GNAT family N-acetyltransferase [Geodermatophilus sp.]
MTMPCLAEVVAAEHGADLRREARAARLAARPARRSVLRMTGTAGTGVPPVRVREAAPAERTAVEALVAGAGLPLDGLDGAAVVLVADVGGTLVGAVALGRHGGPGETVFLLRSAAVDPAWRGRGIG